ncbi:MAG: monovalent cation/H+ antiporter subunit D family protein [Nitrospirae bacterium]|nr:monovalent cation/H+ antiporter subunit D family protein [Nitrospirota bacterium]
MEPIISIRPLLAILVSTAGAFLIILTGEKKPNLREFWSIAAGVLKFLIVVSMVPAILDGKTIEYTLFHLLPGIDIKFKVDAFSILFALGASFLWILTSFYSIGYMRTLDEHAQTRYFTFFAVALSATMGVAFSANLFTMFLFYEGLTIVTYPLVGHKDTDEARAGARKYVVYLLGAAKVFLVAAIILTYNLAGTLEFTRGGLFPSAVQGANPLLLSIIFVLFLFGFAKCAVMPFHGWLPAAMVAPTPVSALLHAVAVVKTGVFTVLRVIFFVFGTGLMKDLGVDMFTVFMASLTILTASAIALSRDNLKARLAFSTISQLSYIILGAALLTPSSMVGGIIHITNHAFSKITLFFCAGSIYASAHKTEVSQLSGIGKKMPWTMAAFAIATLSMIGVPPVSGFITKWYLVVGSLQRQSMAVLIVLLASSLLNAAYFVPIIYKAFFEKEKAEGHGHGHHDEIKEVPLIVVPLVLTAIASVILGLYPDFIINLAEKVIK